AAEGDGNEFFWREMARSELGLGEEKLSHLRFFFHDVMTGKHPTVVRVAEAVISNSSVTQFGSVFLFDDALTLGLNGKNSTAAVVGRAQGIYASADLSELGLLMVLNFSFTRGKFNGSTLSVLGRNAVFSGVRELPIVGGSGAFRFARGYARAVTRQIDFATGNAVVEYNVYAFHY
ncbi:hypothetical protein M569_09689, partial [Genlisea aurea]